MPFNESQMYYAILELQKSVKELEKRLTKLEEQVNKSQPPSGPYGALSNDRD